MAFFTKEYLDFFEDLRRNNDKDWFDENRERYIKHVREPFKDFSEVVAIKIREFDPDIDLSPHIFRINYDLRFYDRDDIYKTHKSASFNIGNWDTPLPGYYLQIGANMIMLGGGMYDIDTKDKYKVRDHIVANLDRFHSLKTDDAFLQEYGLIQGEKHKRIPKNIRDIADDKEPVLYNKSFYYTTELPAELILSNKLLDEVVSRLEIILPLNKFFRDAIVEGQKK